MNQHLIATAWVASFVIITSTAVSAHAGDVFNPGQGLVPLEFVTIGDPGNPADVQTGKGAVAEEFRLARHEVTNAQYAIFLNAVASVSDPNNLWSPDMDSAFGYISRTGGPGNYTYTVEPGRENQPVANVSFWDAARFINWLHNGQGSSDTESGVYQMNGNAIIGGRADGAEYFIPDDDEWYKAAYYQPAADGGDADGWWLYPTASNTLAGNEDLDGANYFDGDFFGGQSFNSGPFSPVGWYTEAPTFYGTFDQGGNVSEWVETLVFGSNRGIRGGNWQWTPSLLEVTGLASASGSYEEISLGFRVGSIAQTTTSIGDERLPQRPQLGLSIYPNPFNPQTTVAFSLPQAGSVNVQVVDLRGRLVTTLASGTRAAGEHTVTWTGRDASGQNVGSGVYLVRVTTPTSTVTARALLMK